jgi:N-acetylmuramoyl-L-alanine amidase
VRRIDAAARRLAAAAWAVIGLAGAAQAAACDRANFGVAIDPGHTAAEPGATSARGASELDFNDRLAARIAAALHDAGFERSFLTRRGAEAITLDERARLANARQARLFVSVHHDSAQPHKLQTWRWRGAARLYTDRISGFSLFVSRLNAEAQRSEQFARLLGARLLGACLHPTLHHAEPIAGENRELLDAAIGLYRFDELAVLRLTHMPAVLLEAGVIVNRADERWLRSAAGQQRLAAAVAAAVADLCEGRQAAAVADATPHASCR